MKLSKTKTIRISETQLLTLQKMKSYKVDVGKFIRDAIKEKINKEYKSFITKQKQDDCLAIQLANQIGVILTSTQLKN